MGSGSAVVILNCRSGCQDKRKIARSLRSIVAGMGVQCTIVLARNPRQVEQAACSAAASPGEIIIAAGGDGTINAVASRLIGTEKRLGIVPVGTFNYFARNLGLPMDLETAFRGCFDAQTQWVTVGEVNGRIFLNRHAPY